MARKNWVEMAGVRKEKEREIEVRHFHGKKKLQKIKQKWEMDSSWRKTHIYIYWLVRLKKGKEILKNKIKQRNQKALKN